MFTGRFPDFAFELSRRCLENKPVSRTGITSTGDIFVLMPEILGLDSGYLQVAAESGPAPVSWSSAPK